MGYEAVSTLTGLLISSLDNVTVYCDCCINISWEIADGDKQFTANDSQLSPQNSTFIDLSTADTQNFF